MSLHKEIMKIPANGFKLSPKYYGEYETVYKLGHQNALSQASKLSLETEKKFNKAIELLFATVNPFDKRTNQQRHEEILKFLEENK